MAEHLNTLADEMVQKGKGSAIRFLGVFIGIIGIGGAVLAAMNGLKEIALPVFVISIVITFISGIYGSYIKKKARFISWVREGVRIELKNQARYSNNYDTNSITTLARELRRELGLPEKETAKAEEESKPEAEVQVDPNTHTAAEKFVAPGIGSASYNTAKDINMSMNVLSATRNEETKTKETPKEKAEAAPAEENENKPKSGAQKRSVLTIRRRN